MKNYVFLSLYLLDYFKNNAQNYMNKITLRLFYLLLFCIGWQTATQAQVGINILAPDTSAILHLESVTRGLLLPRLTNTQRNSIVQPKAGLQIYNTTDSVMQYFNGRCWLATWQRNCDDCAFTFTSSRTTGNIDRIVSNSDSTELYINQIAGANQTMAVYIVPNLPAGISATLSSFVANGSDTIQLNVSADIFAPAGTYPVIVQAVCGNTIGIQVFIVTVEPCIEVDIVSTQVNYDLQAANNLPTATPICVVARIASGVTMTNTANNPVYTSGNLHPDSRVGILNTGDLLGKGGDGGVGSGIAGGGTGGGNNGSDAINLTTHTHIINNGKIYGGGGGGGSVGFLVTVPIPGANFNLGIGAGGGGGAQIGLGGNLGTGFGYYSPGLNASGGVNALPGAGGTLVTPIAFSITVVTITLTPQVFGGAGGGYGIDGFSGSLTVNVRAQISVPFIGTVTIFNQDFPNPPPAGFPAGGTAGAAVKRNGNTLIGINNANYQNNSIRGRVF